ncbi:methyltransferase domain-containing protein [Candidatus Bathyarchaeota archaeon]|nr:methyltransferase domain-containing protein [Candidatus Bathyarchaeota archaeon]
MAELQWRKRSGTRNIWEQKASIYDRYVTRTRNKLLRFYLTKEQNFLDDYLRRVITQKAKRKISIVEIGSGTGRTLLYYAKKPNIINNVEYMIGIDNALAMHNISKFKLTEMAGSFNNSDLLQKYVFLNLNAEELSKYFDNGRILLGKLIDDNIDDCIAKIDERKFNDSVKVVINLLNTLGVIKNTKPLVLHNMVKIAGTDGRVVVSVFDGAKFEEHAQDIYKSIRNIVGKFDLDDFDFDKTEFASASYYSKWFTFQEAKNFMEKAGCTKIRLRNIQDIALFVTSEIKK